MASRGEWAEVRLTVLPAGERAPAVPPETAAVPLEMRVKGFLQEDAGVGDEASVLSFAGREFRGRVTAIWPPHRHDFGRPHHALVGVGEELRRILRGET